MMMKLVQNYGIHNLSPFSQLFTDDYNNKFKEVQVILLMTAEAICFYAKKKGLGQATTYFARYSVKWFGNIVGLPNDC
ncbi:hypothetical protein ACTHRH_17075 [Paenibacillus sp. SAFN-117]